MSDINRRGSAVSIFFQGVDAVLHFPQSLTQELLLNVLDSVVVAQNLSSVPDSEYNDEPKDANNSNDR